MDYLKHIKPGLKPGIYFDLPDELYFKDSSLSRSNLIDLLNGDLAFWHNSWLNPDRRDRDKTKEMDYGSMIDCLLLTPDKFDDKFVVTTGFGLDNRKAVTFVDKNNATSSINALFEVPYTKEVFTGGYPQVTIVWIDEATGVKMSARIDYLKEYIAVDYKSTRSRMKESLKYDVPKYGLDLQAAHYTLGILEARRCLREGKEFHIQGVKGKSHKKWLEEFVLSEEMCFRFVFQEKEFPFMFEVFSLDELIENALIIRMAAIDKYVSMLTKYGTKKPPAGDGVVKSFSVYDMPKYLYTRGIDNIN